MGRWQEWTPCSKECGGGTRTRQRAVLSQAKFGGVPGAETMQEELCNTDPCDQDCELSDWTNWSSCSVACMGGHRTRLRHVVRGAIGAGTCPSASDPERRQTETCNKMTCSNVSGMTERPVCASTLDVVLVLDGSGSVGSEGFAAAKRFATTLLSRMPLVGESHGPRVVGPSGILEGGYQARGSRLGLLTFGSTASVSRGLTTSRSAVAESINALKWAASQGSPNTNTAAALALARQMLDEEINYPSSQSVAIVVTDGPPVSGRLAKMEVERLVAHGVRVMILAVGAGARHVPFQQWASWPAAENVVPVSSFERLPEDALVTKLLAGLCPYLAFG